MIDIHCHLEYLENPKEIIKEARNRGMKVLISSAAEPKDAEKILGLRKEFPNFLFIPEIFYFIDSSIQFKKSLFPFLISNDIMQGIL